MKTKVKITSLFLVLALVFCSTLASAVPNSPLSIGYCPGTPSGYHEGIASGGLNMFFNSDIFPNYKQYIPGEFVLNTCRGCGIQIYVDENTGKYFDADIVQYKKDGLVYYACVDPDLVHSYSGSNPPQWILGFSNPSSSVKENEK